VTPRFLIDAIVQQTTVLIAQLSTAAGVRSPLAHVADQVFLSLTQEIERQGVSRKVVADMFGLALRTYQRKVQRLEESASTTGRTLWEAVLEHVAAQGPARREDILERFRNDEEMAVIAVLTDLVSTGLLYSSGRGEGAIYGVTSETDRSALSNAEAVDALAVLLWGTVFRQPGLSTLELLQTTRASPQEARAAVELLVADGRVTREGRSDDAPLRSSSFVISLGDPEGWEAAVFDHFRAVANGIAMKVAQRGRGGAQDSVIGGSTLHFGIHPGHPHEAEVLGTLERVRGELGSLYAKVSAHNKANQVFAEDATRVTFYFGQSVLPRNEPDAPAPTGVPGSVTSGEIE
jgi:hypothetical protein